jgi:predicted phosphodiesterase
LDGGTRMSNLSNSYPKSTEDFILKKISEGFSYPEILKELQSKNKYTGNYNSFKSYARKLKNRKGLIVTQKNIKELDKKIIKYLDGKKHVNKYDLQKHFSVRKREIESSIQRCRNIGHEIILDNDLVFISKTNVREPEKIPQLSNTEITFGIVSDTHFGSKSCQITALNKFADIMKKKGVKHVFCPGDLVAGYEVYPGQIHDVYALSAQEQEETTLLNLPTGFQWYVLGGNHDYSYIKRGGGYNIISVIASKRTDVHYVGFDSVTIPILNNVDVLLAHPSGGLPYSVSYRLQKNIEQITISELQNVVRGVKDKPTIRFVLLGHLHIQMQALFGSIWGAQCGTFEGQTNYLKRKGLIPAIGGYIIKASLGKNGMLKNFESKFYLFDEIEDDWKNYKHSIPEQKITKPIFE